MLWAKQSTAKTVIIGPILDSTGAEYASAVIGDLSLSKAGATLTALASAATLTYIANGQYTLVFTTGNLDTLGTAQVLCNKATYQCPPLELMILPATVYDALVTNATTAAGGLGDIQRMAGTALTARDIGASVLLSAGTGTGQLDFTSGVVKANLVQILATALTETAGQIAAAFKKFFNIATPASTMDSLTLVATATNLTNAPTSGDFTATMKTSLNAATPASITGAVGSVASGGITVSSLAASLRQGLSPYLYVTGPATAGGNSVVDSYAYAGLTNNLPSFASATLGTPYYIWSDGVFWYISATNGTAGTNFWQSLGTLDGAYAGNGTTSGTATVAMGPLWADVRAMNGASISSATSGVASNFLNLFGNTTTPLACIRGFTWGVSFSSGVRSLTNANNITSDGLTINQGNIAQLDVAVSSRAPASTALSTAVWTAPPTGFLAANFTTAFGHLDADVSSRMATYTQPTGFLAATFPGTVASTTNITSGTIATVTNLTNAPTAGDFTAAMKTSIGTAVGTAQTGDTYGLANGANGFAAIKADTGNLVTRITSTLFSGITSLAQWIGMLAGKQVGNSTARTEIRATGAGAGTYDETVNSLQAIRDRGDTAWITATGFVLAGSAPGWYTAPPSSGTIAAAVVDLATSGHTTAGTFGAAIVAAGSASAAAVWDLTTTGHTTSGTFGAAMQAAGSSGDPLATLVPGSYGPGTAGSKIGALTFSSPNKVDATAASIADGAITDASFTVPALTGPATGFVGYGYQLWRRFFKKSVYDSAAQTIKTYADNGTTVITTQAASKVGTVQTEGPAT